MHYLSPNHVHVHETGLNSVCSFNTVRLKVQTQAGNNAGPISVSSFNRVC